MQYQIKIDSFSSTPKYQQIFNSIIRGIEEGAIQAGDKLPSIPEICQQHDVAKRTVDLSTLDEYVLNSLKTSTDIQFGTISEGRGGFQSQYLGVRFGF